MASSTPPDASWLVTMLIGFVLCAIGGVTAAMGRRKLKSHGEKETKRDETQDAREPQSAVLTPAPKIPEDAPLLSIEECGVLLHKRASESGVGTIKAIRQRDGVYVTFTCWLAGQHGGAHWKNSGPERFLPIPGVAPVALNYQEIVNGEEIYSDTVQQAISDGRYNTTDRFYLL